jgi:hypothetical protein
LVTKRQAKRHTMHEALDQNFWISDIQGALAVSALAEYLELWDLVTEVELQPDVQMFTSCTLLNLVCTHLCLHTDHVYWVGDI